MRMYFLRVTVWILLLALCMATASCTGISDGETPSTETHSVSDNTVSEETEPEETEPEETAEPLDPSKPYADVMKSYPYVEGYCPRLICDVFYKSEALVVEKDGKENVRILFGDTLYEGTYEETVEYLHTGFSYDCYTVESGGFFCLYEDSASFSIYSGASHREAAPLVRSPYDSATADGYLVWLETFMEENLYGFSAEEYECSVTTKTADRTVHEGFYTPKQSSEEITSYTIDYDVYVDGWKNERWKTGKALRITVTPCGDIVNVDYRNHGGLTETIDVDVSQVYYAVRQWNDEHVKFFLETTKEGIKLFAFVDGYSKEGWFVSRKLYCFEP